MTDADALIMLKVAAPHNTSLIGFDKVSWECVLPWKRPLLLSSRLMLRLSFSTLSDHRGSDPALLPLGNQCLDWGDRHRRVSSCTILRGHQAVPNTKEHSGEYLIGSSSRENDHFQGRNYLNVSWMDFRTFMVPRGWIPLTPSMRVTFVVQWNFYKMEARAVSLQAMRRLFILHHHHVTTSVCPALWFTSLWALQPQRDFYFILIMLESS